MPLRGPEGHIQLALPIVPWQSQETRIPLPQRGPFGHILRETARALWASLSERILEVTLLLFSCPKGPSHPPLGDVEGALYLALRGPILVPRRGLSDKKVPFAFRQRSRMANRPKGQEPFVAFAPKGPLGYKLGNRNYWQSQLTTTRAPSGPFGATDCRPLGIYCGASCFAPLRFGNKCPKGTTWEKREKGNDPFGLLCLMRYLPHSGTRILHL